MFRSADKYHFGFGGINIIICESVFVIKIFLLQEHNER